MLKHILKRSSKNNSPKFKRSDANIPTLFNRYDMPVNIDKNFSAHTDIQDEPIHVIPPSPPHIKGRSLTNSIAASRIGIFSDTLLYSEFITSFLQILEVDIKHFGHPNTFNKNTYSQYDDISAWIIFLSDSNGAHTQDYFLDRFLDRYVEKPSLFLCSETNRVKTSEKINQFVIDTGLFQQSTKAYA